MQFYYDMAMTKSFFNVRYVKMHSIDNLRLEKYIHRPIIVKISVTEFDLLWRCAESIRTLH